MEQWLIDHLPKGPGGTVVVYTDAEGFVAVDPAWLSGQIGGLPAPTHAALTALAMSTSGNWQRVWDQWKANGKVA